MRYFLFTVSSLFLYIRPTFSQHDSSYIRAFTIPLYSEKNNLYDSYLNEKDRNEHSSIKPYLNSPALNAITDSIAQSMAGSNDNRLSKVKDRNQRSKGMLAVNGIFTTEVGYEQAAKVENKFLVEGGLSVQAAYKNKLAFYSTFLSGSSAFPSYLDSSIKHTIVIPGMGSAYAMNHGYSYQYYSGYLSYSLNKIFNFQVGKDKHFWGEGYRSLLLSDVSNPFPFIKLSATVWKLKYVSLFANLKDVENPSGLHKDFVNKYGTFHYLSWNASKRLNISFFESIIWQGTDSNRVRKFDVNYLNPMIFYRPVEYSLGSSDNALLGFSYKIKVGKKCRQQFYGQIVIDEFLLKEVLAIFKKAAHPFDHTIQYGWWGNKQGVQFGFKDFDLFTVKNLNFQTEINAVRPYTYSHGSVLQNYSNYNQPLAHPLGANFAESVSFLNYRYKRWIAGAECLYAVYGKDENGLNYGGNIFESYMTRPTNMDYGNKFFQGLRTNLMYTQLKLCYYVLPLSDLLAEAGLGLRQEKNSAAAVTSTYFFIGIKTALMNRYRDY